MPEVASAVILEMNWPLHDQWVLVPATDPDLRRCLAGFCPSDCWERLEPDGTCPRCWRQWRVRSAE